MFYASKPSDALRFGDVVQGYVAATPTLKAPLSAGEGESYTLSIQRPFLLSILSPCCSISDKVLLLVPLIQLRAAFFDNHYFKEDLTRLNRPMSPEQSLPPSAWDKLPPEEKAKRMAQGESYAFLELFIYESHDLFPQYSINRKIGNIPTSAYMIDFRHAFRLNCDRVINPKSAPVESKCLELSIETRAQLREKIAFFYLRVPMEDRIGQP